MIEATTSIDPALRDVPAVDRTGNHQSSQAWPGPAA
jgi:hypothetical protein